MAKSQEKIIKKVKARPKLEREEIVQLLVCDILNGVSRYRCKLKLERDQYPDIKTSELSRSTRMNLLQEAYLKCKPHIEEDMNRRRDMFIARYEDILEECRDQRDRQNAIACLKEMGKILGVYDPIKVDVKGDVNVDITFGLDNEEPEND